MNTERLNYQLDDLKAIIDEVRDKKADDIIKNDVTKIATRYDRLYEVLKLQLAMIGTLWTVMIKDKQGFLTTVPGKFLSEDEAEKAARAALDEQEDGILARLYCDGVFIKEI
jgi:hypothetical protein